MSTKRKLINHYADQFVGYGVESSDSEKLAKKLVHAIALTIKASKSNKVHDSSGKENEEVNENAKPT